MQVGAGEVKGKSRSMAKYRESRGSWLVSCVVPVPIVTLVTVSITTLEAMTRSLVVQGIDIHCSVAARIASEVRFMGNKVEFEHMVPGTSIRRLGNIHTLHLLMSVRMWYRTVVAAAVYYRYL